MIFKNEPVPSHTIAIVTPYVNQSSFHSTASTFHEPFLDSGQFIHVDQEEDHAGEVFENVVDFSADDGQNVYHTIDEDDVNFVADGSSPAVGSSLGDDSVDSYLPQSSYESSNFTGYPDSYHSTSSVVLFTTDSSVLDVPLVFGNDTFEAVSGQAPLIAQKNKLYSLFYIGYKLWYLPLLYAVYHTVLLLYFYFVKLARHYARFPAALKAAAASAMQN